MIEATDLVSLEVEVRELIGEETAKFWTQARVFRAINAEVMRLARQVIGLDVGYFETTYSPTVAATITLPVNCFLVRNVELYINGQWMQPAFISNLQRGQYQTVNASTTYPGAVRFEGNTIVFEDGIGSATAVRIQYTRLPASMFYAAATAGAAATVTLHSAASIIDDIYIGDRFIVLAGDSVGDIRTCSDYVGSTKVMTVSVAWTATPTTASYLSTLLPEPLGKYPDVVAEGAALRLLPRRKDSELFQMLSQGYALDVQEMMSTLSQRQTEQVMRGNYIPTGDE